MNRTMTAHWFTSMSSNSKPGWMAMVRSYVAGFFPGMDERKESLMAQAPSSISSTPGLSHPDVLWIQPLLNKVCVSADTVSVSNTSSRSRTTSCDEEGIVQADGYLHVQGSGRTPPLLDVARQARWIWSPHPGLCVKPSGMIVCPASPPAHSTT